jgi:hypothetical protein
MKLNRSILLIACLLQASAWGQIIIVPPPADPPPPYIMDFGSAPAPSYIGGVTDVVVLDSYLNCNLGYFTTAATDAWLVKRQPDNSLTPVFHLQPQTAMLVGVGPVYSFQPGYPIMGNSAVRAADFKSGLWSARFDFGSVSYTGQLVQIPEPSPALLLLLFGAVPWCLRRSKAG